MPVACALRKCAMRAAVFRRFSFVLAPEKRAAFQKPPDDPRCSHARDRRYEVRAREAGTPTTRNASARGRQRPIQYPGRRQTYDDRGTTAERTVDREIAAM